MGIPATAGTEVRLLFRDTYNEESYLMPVSLNITRGHSKTAMLEQLTLVGVRDAKSFLITIQHPADKHITAVVETRIVGAVAVDQSGETWEIYGRVLHPSFPLWARELFGGEDSFTGMYFTGVEPNTGFITPKAL